MNIFMRIACGIGVFILGFLIAEFAASGIFMGNCSDTSKFFVGLLSSILYLASVIVICTITIIEAVKKYHD